MRAVCVLALIVGVSVSPESVRADPRAATAPQAGIRPASASYWIERGDTRRHEILVDLSFPPPSNEPIFVAIVFDATGSMAPFTNAARRAALGLVEAIHARSMAAHIAVVAIEDRTKAIPRLQWHVHQPFTRDRRLAADAISAIRVGLAGPLNSDGPEPYSCTLVKSAEALGWGAGKRFLVFIGDAEPAFPDTCETRAGVREVRPEDGYQALTAAGIRAIAMYARGESRESTTFFEELGKRTGGVSIGLGSADALPAAVLTGLDANMTLKPRLIVPKEFRERVTAVSGPERLSSTVFRFEVNLVSPPDGPRGRVAIALPVVYTDDAATPLGVARVVVTAGLWHLWEVQLGLLSLLALAAIWFLLRPVARRSLRLYYLSDAPALAALGFFVRLAAAGAIVAMVILIAPSLSERDLAKPLEQFWISLEREVLEYAEIHEGSSR